MKITKTEAFKWFGNLTAYISAILVSFSVHLANDPLTFIGFLISHVIWSVIALRMREWALFGLNFCFIPIDIYAIWIRL